MRRRGCHSDAPHRAGSDAAPHRIEGWRAVARSPLLLHWLRDRRRRKLLEAPFPAAWEAYIEQNVAHAALLDTRERQQLHELVTVSQRLRALRRHLMQRPDRDDEEAYFEEDVA